MEDDNIKEICGALSDTKNWHFLKIKATNGKLEVVNYAQFDVKEEIDLLGLLETHTHLNVKPYTAVD